PEAAACVLWIRVRRGRNDACDAGGPDGIGAGRSAAVRGTRFEGDVERRAVCVVLDLLGILNRFDFRVRLARAAMPALADDLAVFREHRADHWIGRGRAVAAPGETKGEPQELSVGH